MGSLATASEHLDMRQFPTVCACERARTRVYEFVGGRSENKNFNLVTANLRMMWFIAYVGI